MYGHIGIFGNIRTDHFANSSRRNHPGAYNFRVKKGSGTGSGVCVLLHYFPLVA